MPELAILPSRSYGLPNKRCGHSVNDHVAGAGVEGQHLIGRSSSRDGGEVRDPADVLHNPAHTPVAIQKKVEEGNQRCAFATSRHVRGPKIRNHRNPDACSDHCTFAGLPGDRKFAPKKRGSFTLVIQRLTVAAHEFGFETKATLRSQHCISVKFSQQEIQPGEVGAR